jgi:hypothetical protein
MDFWVHQGCAGSCSLARDDPLNARLSIDAASAWSRRETPIVTVHDSLSEASRPRNQVPDPETGDDALVARTSLVCQKGPKTSRVAYDSTAAWYMYDQESFVADPLHRLITQGAASSPS